MTDVIQNLESFTKVLKKDKNFLKKLSKFQENIGNIKNINVRGSFQK